MKPPQDLIPTVVSPTDQPESHPRTETIPTHLQIPGYRLIAEIGRGASGIVYQAEDLTHHRIVALKIMQILPSMDERQRKRFTREARLSTQLDHEHIVRALLIGEHRGMPFIVQEWIDGPNLWDFLNGNPLPPTQAAQLVEQIARAIHFAHQRQVVHRDLKPENVLLLLTDVHSPQVKVTDFGLAKQIDGKTRLTSDGAILGTPSYMAPEQVRGIISEVGVRSDVYSLGAILFACLTGRPPFDGPTIYDILDQIPKAPVPAPRAVEPRVSLSLNAICMKCLATKPESRFSSAKELADELQRFHTGQPTKTSNRTTSLINLRIARLVLLTAALIVILLVDLLSPQASTAWKSQGNCADTVVNGITPEKKPRRNPLHEQLRQPAATVARFLKLDVGIPRARVGSFVSLTPVASSAGRQLTSILEEELQRQGIEISPISSPILIDGEFEVQFDPELLGLALHVRIRVINVSRLTQMSVPKNEGRALTLGRFDFSCPLFGADEFKKLFEKDNKQESGN